MCMNEFYKDKYDVIIIGASLAGLTAALTLKKEGYDVLVLEQHNLPGGVATSFVRGGVELEASLHEMMSIGSKEYPLKIRKFLEENDIFVDWVKVPIAYRYVDDEIDFVLHAGTNGDFSLPAKEIAEACKDKDGSIYNKLMEFFTVCLNIYKSTNSGDIDKLSKIQMIKRHPDLVKSLGYSVQEVFDALKLPNKVQDILAAYWVYLGSPVKDLPFTVYGFMLADYLGYGSYIPRNTSHEMSLKVLEKVESLGVQVEFNQRVKSILVKDNKVQGVRLKNDEVINSTYVISGAYPNSVYSSMIEPKEEVPEDAIKWVNAMELSLSVFSLILLLDKDYKELGIKDYATFYSPKGMHSNDTFNSGYKIDTWDYIASICINVAIEDASPKNTCVYSITYLPMGEAFKDIELDKYEDYKNKLIDHFIEMESKRLGINLKDHIIETVVETPLSVSHYTGAYMGSIYGYRHKMNNHTAARLQTEMNERYISGLAFAGAHQIDGDGMAVAFTNGIKGAKEIMEEDAKRKAGK